MRTRVVWVLALLAGCGDDGPPLDDLPLRDALRAAPDTVTALPADRRKRLAARLETARTSDGGGEQFDGDAGTPAALVARMDAARVAGARPPLIVGTIAGDVVRPLGDPVAVGGGDLPPLESPTDMAATFIESHALAGQAGRLLRALLDASGSHRLRRVVGWPTGAVALGDTVYVNAAWLVALAADDDADTAVRDGAVAQVSLTRAPLAPGAAEAATPLTPEAGAATAVTTGRPADASPRDGGVADAGMPNLGLANVGLSSAPTYPGMPDGGVDPPPPPTDDTSDSCGASADACATGADACSTSGDDSCGGTTEDGSADSCGGTTDGSADSCGGTTDDSTDSCGGNTDGSTDSCNNAVDDGSASGCQVGRGQRRDRRTTLAGLLAPLVFLLTRRRR